MLIVLETLRFETNGIRTRFLEYLLCKNRQRTLKWNVIYMNTVSLQTIRTLITRVVLWFYLRQVVTKRVLVQYAISVVLDQACAFAVMSQCLYTRSDNLNIQADMELQCSHMNGGNILTLTCLVLVRTRPCTCVRGEYTPLSYTCLVIVNCTILDGEIIKSRDSNEYIMQKKSFGHMRLV